MAIDQGWDRLLDRLGTSEASVGVVGLGYVGLPVAVRLARAGFSVIGVDSSPERVAPVQEGRSDLVDVDSDELARWVADERLSATQEYEPLAECDAVLICVPTPLKNGDPDLGAIIDAGTRLGQALTAGTLVVLESTTYPGTTQEILEPLLEKGGLKSGVDFLLAYSPERIDPGNEQFPFEDIPKVVGGTTPEATQAAETLYGRLVPKVIAVSSPREAELSKLIENTYRHVNIALVNELAVYAHELGIDIWEAIEAAASKPFGFQPFLPGPGWGGHCIPLDPSYLSWRVRQSRSHEVRFVELAQQVGSEVPRWIVERIGDILNEDGKAVRGARILGIGAAYKAGTEDTRHSPGLEVLGRLITRGAEIGYHDPMVPEVEIDGTRYVSESLDEALDGADLVVIFIPQRDVDWSVIKTSAHRIFDTCNALGLRSGGNVIRL